MPAEQDYVQLVLLRILGVLLIAVGFALIAQQVRSDSMNPIRLAQALVSDVTEHATRCEGRRVHVHVQSANIPPPAPVKRPPLPSSPPRPPAPAAPSILSL